MINQAKMGNKLISILGVFIFTLVILSTNVSAETFIDVSLDYDPFPVQAGDTVELTFTIENIHDENLTNLEFKLDVNNPFSISGNDEKFISEIEMGESETITYKIFVEGDAEEGEESITLEYRINESSWKDEDFDIRIAPTQVYLEIIEVEINPEEVAPGEDAEIKLTLQNKANSEIRDALIRLNITELPFSLNGTTERHIETLQEREEETIEFILKVSADAEIRAYNIPLSLEYYDSYGQKYIRQDLISIDVFEKPEIDVSVEENKLIQNMNSLVALKILNKGLADVNFVELKLLPSNTYEINGRNYEYLGNIESDDYETIEFELLPKKDKLVLQVQLDYRDANNKKYSEIKTINLDAYTIQEAQAKGLLPSFPWIVLIIILVIIGLIIFFVIRRKVKKKKRMQQQM